MAHEAPSLLTPSLMSLRSVRTVIHGRTVHLDYVRSGSNCGVKSLAAPGTLYS
jgi:hypothetical protein